MARYDPTIYQGAAPHYRRRSKAGPSRRAPGRRRSRTPGYFSLSTSAPHLFGDRVEDFASEVQKLLRTRSPINIFWDWPGDTDVILARKPSR